MVRFLRQKKCLVNENVYTNRITPLIRERIKGVKQDEVVSSKCVKRTGEKATPAQSAMKSICRMESGPQ